MELEGKVALVTGASQGIGRAIAERFAREGAQVVVNYIGDESAGETVERTIIAAGGHAIDIHADISKRDEVEAMVERAISELGRIDVLVNNAGVTEGAPFLEMTDEQWDAVLRVDLRGTFLCTQVCARRMAQQGSGAIVNISSIHEDLPFPGFAQYCAAKGGMRMLMRSLALELAPLHIRVNNIAPGAIATPRNELRLNDPTDLANIKRVIPLARLGTPDEVASVAVFLASDRASYVTGSTYYVDGGMLRHSEAV